jgi:hypothetical protein
LWNDEIRIHPERGKLCGCQERNFGVEIVIFQTSAMVMYDAGAGVDHMGDGGFSHAAITRHLQPLSKL